MVDILQSRNSQDLSIEHRGSDSAAFSSDAIEGNSGFAWRVPSR